MKAVASPSPHKTVSSDVRGGALEPDELLQLAQVRYSSGSGVRGCVC